MQDLFIVYLFSREDFKDLQFFKQNVRIVTLYTLFILANKQTCVQSYMSFV